MRNVCTIMSKELRSIFASPIAYVVLMVFLGVTGYFFFTSLLEFRAMLQQYEALFQLTRNPQWLERLNLNFFVIARVLSNMLVIFLFIIPLIMMRSFAEEKKNGTEELLMTSPISVNELIAGKFLGALLFLLICLAPTAVYQVFLFAYAKPEPGPVLSGYLGVLLFGGCGLSIGLFASSLTENQIIAAVASFVLLLFLFIIGILVQGETTALAKMISYISIQEHIENLLKGVVNTKDVVYFLSICAFFLFLTKRSLESVRWR